MATKTRPGSKAASDTGSPRPKTPLGFLPEALRSSPDATILVGAAGEILDANELAERLFGYAKNELHGQMVEALIPANVRSHHRGHRAGFNSSPSRRPMGRGMRLSGVRKDGSEFVADIALSPVQTQNETLILVAVRDLTEREQAEAALRESEERFRQMVDSSPNPIFSLNRQGIIQIWNASCENVFQYPKGIIGQGYLKLLPNPEERSAVATMVSQVFQGSSLSGVDLSYRCKDGTERFMVSRLYPLLDHQGRVQECVFANTDVTDRKRAEEALRESEERFRTLYTRTPVMLHSIDVGGRIVAVSDHWLEVLGYQRDEVIGRKSVEFLTEESKRYAETVTLPEFWKTLCARDIPYQLVKKNGEIIDVLLSSIGERDADGKICRTLAVLEDVTERNRMEEALRQARDELETKIEKKISQSGAYGLTFREMTVLSLVAEGKSDKEIALALAISPYTVSKHVASILLKMDAHSRTEAGVRAVREGLVG